MKNKIVYGAYGGVNAGDEYILHSIKKNSSNDEMSIICEWPNISTKTLEYYKNYKIKPIRRNEVLKVLKEVISKDLVIGGGQIINGGPAIKSMFYIAFLVIINKLTLNEPSIFSAGTGEIKSRPDRILARIIFKLCKVVLMRDENSYQQAKIYSNKAKKTADVVFTNGLLQSKERKNILIAVHGSPSVKYQDDSTINKIITTLLENGFDRENIKIIAHDRRINYDVKVAEHLADKFSLNYKVLETPLEVNNEFEKASTVISARMHPLIIGSLYKCNLFYFGNSKKIKDLAKETNIENASVVLEDIQRLNNCSKIKIDRLLKDSLANFTYMEIQMFFQNNFIRTILMYGYQNLSALKKVEYEKKIFINSIPKSGTHLITNLLDADKRMLNSGYHLKKYTVNLLSNNEFENLKFKLDKEKFSRILEKNKKGRLISTHLPWDSNFDNSFLGINTIYKKIFFVRDPRDIFLSEFYYIKNLKRHFQHDAFMSLANDEERFKILLYGGRIKDIPFKSYSEKLDEYCGWLNCKDIKVLKYENFASQCVEEDRLYGNLKDLFIFLELKLDEEIFEEIIKTNESKKSYTFRKGGSGGWKEKLSSEQKLRMNEQLEKACRVLDYDTEI